MVHVSVGLCSSAGVDVCAEGAILDRHAAKLSKIVNKNQKNPYKLKKKIKKSFINQKNSKIPLKKKTKNSLPRPNSISPAAILPPKSIAIPLSEPFHHLNLDFLLAPAELSPRLHGVVDDSELSVSLRVDTIFVSLRLGVRYADAGRVVFSV